MIINGYYYTVAHFSVSLSPLSSVSYSVFVVFLEANKMTLMDINYLLSFSRKKHRTQKTHKREKAQCGNFWRSYTSLS